MGRRRTSGVRALLRRLRWGNVASLVLLVTSLVLITTGRREEAPRREPERRIRAPAEVEWGPEKRVKHRAPPGRAKPRRAKRARRNGRQRARGPRRPAGDRVAVEVADRPPVEQGETEAMAETVVEKHEPAPVEPAPPPPRSGEFTPDPGPWP